MSSELQKFWDKWYIPILFSIGYLSSYLMNYFGLQGGLWK